MTKTVMMPTELTAENGAKKLMAGQFFIPSTQECEQCWGEGERENEECEDCCGIGSETVHVAIDWATIKEIYDKAVEHFGH